MYQTKKKLHELIEGSFNQIYCLSHKTFAIYNKEQDLVEIYYVYYLDVTIERRVLLGRSTLIAEINSDDILTVKDIKGIYKYIDLAYSERDIKAFYTNHGYDLIYYGHLIYDIHLISTSSIDRITINKAYRIPPTFPVVPIYTGTKLKINSDPRCIEYVEGVIIYVTDIKALEEIRFILLLICYLNSSVNTKYDLLVFSIHHASKEASRSMYRASGTRLTSEYALSSKDLNKHPIGQYAYTGRKIIQSSKQLVELGRLIEIWLERNNLYTGEEVKISNYIVDIKNINPLDAAKFIANNPLREIYDAKL